MLIDRIKLYKLIGLTKIITRNLSGNHPRMLVVSITNFPGLSERSGASRLLCYSNKSFTV